MGASGPKEIKAIRFGFSQRLFMAKNNSGRIILKPPQSDESPTLGFSVPTRNCQQSKLFRQPRHRKFDKSVTKRPVSCDSICRNEVIMARHKGRGSPRPSTRASHPSAPCRIQSSLVLHGKHAFLGAFLSLSL